MEIHKIYLILGSYTKYVIDSRKVSQGSVFFALKGDKSDGNTFATSALEAGADYVVVDNKEIVKDERYILVDDVLTCMQELAKIKRLDLYNTVIGLTGSNGKTTTKELCRDVLAKKFKVHATQGNYNNHIGLPLTILQAPLDAEILLLEMGANHQGEINDLCQIGSPNYGLITNIGKAHLEGFGGIEGVKKGKSEMYRFLNQSGGSIFINTDDDVLVSLLPEESHLIRYSVNKDLHKIESNPVLSLEYKSHTIQTNLYGEYNISNIGCALAIGQYFGVELSDCIKAIEEYLPENNRSQLITKGSTTIVLDAYNANPSSMSVAISNFSKSGGKKIIVLGDMLELGETTDFEHEAIINWVIKHSIEKAYFVGPIFFKLKNRFNFNFYLRIEDLMPIFKDLDIKDTTILLKGSRGMAVERLLEIFE